MRRISNTQIAMFMRCPRQWEFRYVKGLKIPPKGIMVQGSAYHGALKENFTYKVRNGIDLDVKSVLDAYDTTWRKSVDEGKRLGELDWEGEDPGKIKDQGIKLVKIYHNIAAPSVEPVSVEKEFVRNIGNDIQCNGYIDLNTTESIIDHKVKGRAFTQDEANRDPQPTMYCFLRGVSNFVYHTAIKKKVPEIQLVNVEKNEDDINWWIEAVKQMMMQIDAGIFPPNFNGWHCSEKGCGYWHLCQEMRGRVFSFAR